MSMTLLELFNDHAARVAQVTRWYYWGWISQKQRIRYLASDTDLTYRLYDQMVREQAATPLY